MSSQTPQEFFDSEVQRNRTVTHSSDCWQYHAPCAFREGQAAGLPFTERDLELIEVALEAAASACQPSVFSKDRTDDLANEYKHALIAVKKIPVRR